MDVSLKAGLYEVSATLPGGRRHSEIVAVGEGEATGIVLDREGGQEPDAAVSFDTRDVVARADDDVPPAELVDQRACIATDRRGTKWRFDPDGEPEETPQATFSVAGTTVTASLPLNPRGKPDERGCTVRFVRRGERVRVDVGFGGSRRVASTLEGLVKSDDVVSTATLFSEAEDVLYAKYQDPAAAALGGLTLHRIGRLPDRRGWVENLARDLRWVADGRILLAALLADAPDPDERTRGLQELLGVAAVRPLFGDGLALLLKLLRSWPDESSHEERRAALAAIPTDVAAVDWTAMALTTYDED
jgi:hypothetical protein